MKLRPTHRLSSSPTLAAVFVLLALFIPACADETALDLHFVVNVDIADEKSLAAALSSMQVVLDAPAGLYPLGTPSPGPGLELVDLDQDGWLEVRATVELGALGRLPVIRIDRGGLQQESVELRVDGLSATQVPLAAGGLKSVRFVDGQLQRIDLPFNLRPGQWPPFVKEIYPEDGVADVLPSSTGSLLVVFSKPMNHDSLLAANVIQLLRVDGEQEIPMPAKRIEPREQYAGGPTMAEYHLGGPLQPETLYRVRVTSGAQDTSGRPLDQRAQESGNQGFASQFTTTTDPASAPACIPNCSVSWCSSGGKACPAGLLCDEKSGSCLPAGCPTHCAARTVCDAALAACVPDCRLYGSYGGCPDARPVCDAAGLCQAP